MANTPKAKSKDMGPIMFLSLFLLLLAFFILLNTLSTFEEVKARQVIKSLTATFRTDLTDQTEAQVLISTLEPLPEAQRIIDEVEQLWVTAIPLTKDAILKDGSVMQITVPTREIFVVGELDLRSDRLILLRDTAAALSQIFEGSVIELQFMLGVGSLLNLNPDLPDVVDDQPDDTVVNPEEINLNERDGDYRSLAFARAGIIANKLVDFGAPPYSISVGLRHADPKLVRMRFFIHEENTAFNTFANEAVDAGPASFIRNQGNPAPESPAPE